MNLLVDLLRFQFFPVYYKKIRVTVTLYEKRQI
jgi:hypothetical protein